MAKKSLNLEEHKFLAINVHHVMHHIIDTTFYVRKMFPKSSKTYKQAQRVLAAFDLLRSELDNEYYEVGGEGNSPYYGSDSRDK